MKTFAKIKSQLKSGEKVIRNFATSRPEIEAHIIITPILSIDSSPSGQGELVGYAVDAATCTTLSENKIQRTYKDVNNIELDVMGLCVKIAKSCRPKKNSTTGIQKVSSITDALKSCKSEINTNNFPNWAPSTLAKAFSYLLHSIAPKMDEIGESIHDSDMKAIKDALYERAKASKRGRTAQNGTMSKNVGSTLNGVNDKFYRAEILYNWIRNQHPEFGLPDVKFPVGVRVKAVSREQVKSLPNFIRIRLAALIDNDIEDGEPLAYGAAFMLYQGTRTNEAAAPLIGEFEFFENIPYGRYFVESKIVNGKRNPLLKTSSYRFLAIIYKMMQIVKKKKTTLLSAGYASEDIPKMPFVSKRDAPWSHADPKTLSAYIRTLLIRAGCSHDYLSGAEQLMYTHPEYDDENHPIYDLSAYILRRDWASRL